MQKQAQPHHIHYTHTAHNTQQPAFADNDIDSKIHEH
jgi:hypothetical protein